MLNYNLQRQNNILTSPIEYLKGVGPNKGALLKKEKNIFTFYDLLFDFPFKYVDRTQIFPISSLNKDGDNVQIRGQITSMKLVKGNRPRLEAKFEDSTSSIKLLWFRGYQWIQQQIKKNTTYTVFGKINVFRGQRSIPHPEMELYSAEKKTNHPSFTPFYQSTEKLNAKGLDSKGRRKLIRTLLAQITDSQFVEYLPAYLIERMRLMPFSNAIRAIHFPKSNEEKRNAINRFKFEELFRIQLQLIQRNKVHKLQIKGYPFETVGSHFHEFYQNSLPFSLTNAQKRVIKEIRRDMGAGIQMNRLLQGDVGSGKTIVALMVMLIAIDNGFQACIMAPTEILAIQHFQSISAYLASSSLTVGFLSGNVKGKKRKAFLEDLSIGKINIAVGTHALIEDPVVFQKLGLAITDEQHRFGVKQRAKLWTKSKPYPPHVLVMTATPIPRTLSMTVYGDLDLSIIDELPPGRKLIKTQHIFDSKRPELIKFVKSQISKGRQIYIVFPLIEESSKLDLQDLERGYDLLLEEFPRPEYQISIVHGRQKPVDKEKEMANFAAGNTDIMVATTVIEVGVDVPNASVMIIMNAERFGLSQLHQLRGRVGRGADQSYCILYSSYKLSADAKKRISTMCGTNDGFKIAEVDLELRGPGDMIGTRQSGELPLNIANLATDGPILQTARAVANRILDSDPYLDSKKNQKLRKFIDARNSKWKTWSQIG